MGKLVVSKSLVERVAQNLRNRNELYSSALLPPDANAAVLAEAEKQAFNRFVHYQPGLLYFYLITTSDISDEGRAVGFFLCEVILDSFLLAGWKERLVDTPEFFSALKYSHEVARQVRFMQTEFPQHEIRWSQIFRQAELIDYLADEVLLKGNNKVCPHKMVRDDALGQLFIVLKSIIDVLDADSEVDDVPDQDSKVNPNAN